VGSGGGQTQTGSVLPKVPAVIGQLTGPSSKSWLEAMKAANARGGIPSLLNPSPEQIAQLTPEEMASIRQMQSIGASGSPQDAQTQAMINQLVSGDLGSNPDVQAQMRAFNQNVMPTISSAMGASGGGRGGELLAAESQADVSALPQFIQGQRAALESGIGAESALSGMRTSEIQQALQNSDLVRQVQQQGYSANFADQQRRQALMQQLIMGPISQWGGSLIGSGSSSSVTTPGKF